MTRHIFVFATLLVCAVGIYFIKQRQNSLPERIYAMESGVEPWHKGDTQEKAKRAEALFAQARQSLERHDLPGSFKAYHQARGAIHYLVEQRGTNELKRGVTLRQWYESLEKPYLAAVSREFSEALKQLERGDIPYNDIKQLITDFDYVGHKDLKQQFEKAKDRIVAARARAATRWVRVDLNPDRGEYTDLVREALLKRWNTNGGFRLVFGFGVDHREEDTVFKKLQVSIRVSDAQYRLASRNAQNSSVSLPEVPESVEVEFRTDGRKSVPTSWDNLPPIRVQADLPERIRLKPEFRNGGAEAERVMQKARNDLLNSISRSVGSLPGFRLFPDANPVTLSIRNEKGLDLPAARALGYLDRNRFVTEINALERLSDPAVFEPVAALVMELEIEALSPLVARQLPSLEPQRQESVLEELGRRPWFGNYEPLLAVIQNPRGNYFPYNLLKCLEGQLCEPRLRAAVLAQLQNSSGQQRQNYLGPFIRQSTPEELRPLTRAWMGSPDSNFVTAVLMMTQSAHPELAAELTFEFFDRLDARAKYQAIVHLKFNEKTQAEQAFGLLRKAALQTADKSLRHQAVQQAKPYLYNPRGWDLCLELLQADAVDAASKSYFTHRLADTVRQARPDKADAFLAELLKSPEGHLREAAVEQLLYGDSPKEPALRILAQAVEQNPGDTKLLGDALGSLAKHFAKGRGWDSTVQQPDLQALLAKGAASPDRQIRQRTYQAMARMLSFGHAQFRDSLNTALQNETDAQLKTEFSRRAQAKAG